jgi:hypothetical protein
MLATEGAEIARLIELMPASGRMYCKLISAPKQAQVMRLKLPMPNQATRSIWINFDLWQQLTQPQRDLLLLHGVSWLLSIQWFKPAPAQGFALAGIVVTGLELLQTNAAGVITFAGLTAVAVGQIWRQNRGDQLETAADEKAVQVAQRRGYTQAKATQALVEAIATVAQIEGRDLSLTETLRQQRLRAIVSVG